MSKPSIIVLLMAISSLLVHNVTSQPPTKPTYVADFCDATDEDYDSEHALNTVAVLEELKKQAFKAPYYNTSSGSGENKVYGQYYCRGDIDSSLCGQCIEEASRSSSCFGPTNYIVVLYEECALRYDNRSMVGTNSDGSRGVSRRSGVNVSDSDRFGSVLNNTMDRLISKVLNGNGSLLFATGEGMVSESDTVYCLVQCSPYLSRAQCGPCLALLYTSYNFQMIITTEWVVRWAFLYFYNCQVRYSNYGTFYRMTPNAPPGSSTSAVPPGLTPSSELPHVPAPKGKNTSYYVVRAVIPAVVAGLLTILGISFCLVRRKIVHTDKKVVTPSETIEDGAAESEARNTECVHFNFKTIELATNNFSLSNKLGQGGFGIVYQGVLNDGQDIAVKRLSKTSGQGTKEFKTEVAVVAKLQHRNLVRLVGCCVAGEERLLVYEFVRNLSLDHFLFDATRSTYMTWATRHKIIQGIARGLHYLHEDSRVKIVHRDLKISNILLDDNLEPKIADFGLAKLVKVDQTADNTTKVVGTYGHMSPEYALAGRYSTKSDVYSFGVIVLEILSGKVNGRFYDMSNGLGLLGHAWSVWNKNAVEKLMDPVLQNSYSKIEAENCLQIGLLCVQDDEANRPPMHAVLAMLIGNTIDLPLPLSPSHSSYTNKLTSCDETQEGTSEQKENESRKSSLTLSLEQDLHPR